MCTQNNNTQSAQPTLSDVTSAGQGPTAPQAATPVAGPNMPKCTDPTHLLIFRQLMKLYTESSERDNYVNWEWKAPDLPDKHDIHNMMSMINDTHASIKFICQMVKKVEPELEMIEGPKYMDSESEEEEERKEESEEEESEEEESEEEESSDEADRNDAKSNEVKSNEPSTSK